MTRRHAGGTMAFLLLACCAAAREPAASTDVRAAFDEAAGRLKKLMADLTVLQAQYQQPKADKAAVAARFERTKREAEVAGGRLESAAVALLSVSPDDSAARQIVSGTMAGALQADDPARVLAIAASLEAAGVADADAALLAATAATILSRLEEAEAWLDRATGRGEQAAELRAAIDRDRPRVAAEVARRKAEAEADDLPRVKFVTSAGEITLELFENEAPNTVANFLSLVEKGFYDGTPFHRVIGGFMAQGGDPTGTGGGGPGYAIDCECGGPDARRHLRGSLSMAHAGKDTGGSQFFLMFRPADHLDGLHTVFGRVVDGDDVLPRLARTQDAQGRSVPGIQADRIVRAEVLRKRDHPYEPRTRPQPRRREPGGRTQEDSP